MKFNIVNLLYLFFRLAPMIIVTFFSLQFVFNYDFISIVYLIGLIFACLTNIAIGNVFYGKFFRNRSAQTETRKKEMSPMCKVFELTPDGPLSNIPLGQTVLSYSLFFLLLIIIKNDVKTLDWKKTYEYSDKTLPTVSDGGKIYIDNIPFFVILPLLILGDMFWNIKYGCDAFPTLFVSLVIGGVIGIAWSYFIDTTFNSRYTGGPSGDQADIGVTRSNNLKRIPILGASYSSYATGKEIDISLFNVINNNVCEKSAQRTIYKCRNIANPMEKSSDKPAISGAETVSDGPMTDLEKLNQILKELPAPDTQGNPLDVNIGNNAYKI